MLISPGHTILDQNLTNLLKSHSEHWYVMFIEISESNNLFSISTSPVDSPEAPWKHGCCHQDLCYSLKQKSHKLTYKELLRKSVLVNRLEILSSNEPDRFYQNCIDRFGEKLPILQQIFALFRKFELGAKISHPK